MDQNNTSKRKEFLCASLAGGCAGIAVDFTLFPIDSLKTRVQASTDSKNYTTDAKKVHKFRGFVSNMLPSFPCAAIFWASYEFSKSAISNNKLGKSMSLPIQHFCAASIACAFEALVRNPFEVVKQNQQIGKYETIIEACKDIYCHKGISGFYRGYFSVLLREIPFSGLQFSLYEYLKKTRISYISKTRNIPEEQVEINFWNNAMNGSLAGSIPGFLITPIDVIKTRRMTCDLNKQEISIPKLVSKIYTESGFQGFYKGGFLRVVYLSVGGCAFFGIYEQMRTYLESSLYA
ncbi:unnamed protein product [Moneuplotes crassus]|uniref:Mitochondrial carrier protein n=1 Tax=Euplotes crassus TaxID=5936 RepID=A0AAD1XRF5_EUPCR|nr:unnamed protein product [Moneuplotes crassus]